MNRFDMEALIGRNDVGLLTRFLLNGEGDASTAWAADVFGDLAADAGYGSFERAYWGEMARNLFSGLLPALAHLRDMGQAEFNAAGLRGKLDLRRLAELSDPLHHPTMPSSYRDAIHQYLTSLPGYDHRSGGKQAQTTFDHHGHLVIRICAVLSDLTEIANDPKADRGAFAPG